MLHLSFFTPEYAGEAAEWLESAERWGLETMQVPIPTTGSWERNCQMKAFVIRDAPKPHVYTDVDARFRQKPVLFDTLDCDFAAHIHHWDRRGRKWDELISATLYFNDTEPAHRLIERWIEINEQNHRIWDQKNLQKALEEAGDGIRFVNLPASYCKNTTLMKDEPVIEQMQASRRYRRAINKRGS